MVFTFRAALWLWEARSSRYWMVSLPPDAADDITALPSEPRGFGSVKVEVTLGQTVWRTSVFPSDETYMLPVKRAVLTAEGVEDGAEIELTVRVLT